MRKRLIIVNLAICSLVISFMTAYFTMFANVNGLDLFLNKTSNPENTTAAVRTTPVVQKTTAAAITTQTPAAETEAPIETTAPAINYTDISIAAAGDLLIHSNILDTQYNAADKTYDFTNIFSQIQPILSKADYAIASLEVPFGGGTAPGSYTGFPQFNCPDSLLGALKNTGFNALMTAGTHAFDKGASGFNRTIETISSAGLENTGTKGSAGDKNYIVRDIKGLKVGIINYTAAARNAGGKISLNGNTITAEQEKLINLFEYGKLDEFYNNVSKDIENMTRDGAEFFMIYIRWGTSYKTAPDDNQKNIAKALCKTGIDVIMGNGPYMVQPFEVLKEESSGREVLCMYSLGNFLSNQRKEILKNSGHTEDGIIYTINIRKYNDGSIKLMKVEYVPTWVRLESGGQTGKQVYTILPFDDTNNKIKEANESYKRTEALVKKSIDNYNNSINY